MRDWHWIRTLALACLLAACGPKRDHDIPEIAGPCPGPSLPVKVIGAKRLNDGSAVVLVLKLNG
jgi:hypothetical protein